MPNPATKSDAMPGPHFDRRSEFRETAVLRVALLTSKRGTCFCLLTNMSANGFQARIYGDVRASDQVTLDVPDETQFHGTVVWCHDGYIGVRLRRRIEPKTVLRMNDNGDARKRRRLPRLQVNMHVTLKISQMSFDGELQDISNSGAMIAMADAMAYAGPVMLVLPNLEPIKGQVRWLDNDKVGISFNSPLSLQDLASWLSQRGGSCPAGRLEFPTGRPTPSASS
ncbi:MAG TPA: PilZ domain-containing protein [Sphingomicrobium sp.]